jgi:hypothetical protein
MVVLVTGGRDYADTSRVFDALDAIKPSFVIEGGARGADALARAWRTEREVPGYTVEADWNRYGRSAGTIRNRNMLINARKSAVDCGMTLVVLAFPGGRGTADMVDRAEREGVKVQRVPRA